jgi:hypothetical protein
MSSYDGMIAEDVTLVRSATDFTDSILVEIRNMADWLKRRLDQECILVQLNHETFFL